LACLTSYPAFCLFFLRFVCHEEWEVCIAALCDLISSACFTVWRYKWYFSNVGFHIVFLNSLADLSCIKRYCCIWLSDLKLLNESHYVDTNLNTKDLSWLTRTNLLENVVCSLYYYRTDIIWVFVFIRCNGLFVKFYSQYILTEILNLEKWLLERSKWPGMFPHVWYWLAQCSLCNLRWHMVKKAWVECNVKLGIMTVLYHCIKSC
jgi:hypothetical protein